MSSLDDQWHTVNSSLIFKLSSNSFDFPIHFSQINFRVSDHHTRNILHFNIAVFPLNYLWNSLCIVLCVLLMKTPPLDFTKLSLTRSHISKFLISTLGSPFPFVYQFPLQIIFRLTLYVSSNVSCERKLRLYILLNHL